MVEEYIDELAPFLAIQSVSADPAHAADVRAAGEWVCDFVRRAGGACELVQNGEHPLAIGEIHASSGSGQAPTVMVYGHFDVQPPAPLDQWDSEPFAPEVRDGWLYARGVADDKGQVYMLLRAAADLADEGTLPVNVRVCCDGEEEIGGHSVVNYLADDERGTDACVIFDSSFQGPARPAFNIATRDILYFHLKLRTGRRDLHSGLYGGAALNALNTLATMLAPTLARDGRLPEPLRQGIAPVTDEEQSAWHELRSGVEELDAAGALPMDAAAAEEFYLRVFAEPTCEINGIIGGEPILHKSIVPVAAEANVSLRLAPGQDPDTIAAAFERMLREAIPPRVELELTKLGSSSPGHVPPGSPAVQLGLDAFERALGVRPLLVRTGGTLPIMPALGKRGIPTVLTGFAVPDSNIHSPNERIPVDNLRLGVSAARELLLAFRELPPEAH